MGSAKQASGTMNAMPMLTKKRFKIAPGLSICRYYLIAPDSYQWRGPFLETAAELGTYRTPNCRSFLALIVSFFLGSSVLDRGNYLLEPRIAVEGG